MSGRLVGAEWLKLRKRRPLFWWSLVLTVGVVTTVFTILEILHLANPVHHGPPGGLDGFSGGMMGLVAAGSIVLLPMVTLGFAVVMTGSIGFAGQLPTPTGWMIARGYGWVVLFTSFDVVVALGFSSLIGSRATTIGVLIGWQHIASPLLEQVKLLGGARQALFTGALDRLNPAPAAGEGAPPIIIHSATVAAVVLVAWMALMLLVWGWRTATRDA